MTDSPESILTPELRSWIGRSSRPAQLETMAASDVRRYVDATGDANPLWLDDDFARSAGYREPFASAHPRGLGPVQHEGRRFGI